MLYHFTKHLKRVTALLALALAPFAMKAQGWPANYGGVMLQGFYWDSFYDTQWTRLTSQEPLVVSESSKDLTVS